MFGYLYFQALKAIKTSDFMSYIVFIAAAPVEIMRNMHELARQRGKTDRMRTVSTAHLCYFDPPSSQKKLNFTSYMLHAVEYSYQNYYNISLD